MMAIQEQMEILIWATCFNCDIALDRVDHDFISLQ